MVLAEAFVEEVAEESRMALDGWLPPAVASKLDPAEDEPADDVELVVLEEDFWAADGAVDGLSSVVEVCWVGEMSWVENGDCCCCCLAWWRRS